MDDLDYSPVEALAQNDDNSEPEVLAQTEENFSQLEALAETEADRCGCRGRRCSCRTTAPTGADLKALVDTLDASRNELFKCSRYGMYMYIRKK